MASALPPNVRSELLALQETLQSLGEELAAKSKGLAAGSSAIDRILLARWQAADEHCATLGSQIRGAAVRLGLPHPLGLTTVPDLLTALDEIEARGRRVEAGLAIVRRFVAVRPTSEESFAQLETAQAEAREWLRAPDTPAEVLAVAESQHPVSRFVELVEGRRSLDTRSIRVSASATVSLVGAEAAIAAALGEFRVIEAVGGQSAQGTRANSVAVTAGLSKISLAASEPLAAITPEPLAAIAPEPPTTPERVATVRPTLPPRLTLQAKQEPFRKDSQRVLTKPNGAPEPSSPPSTPDVVAVISPLSVAPAPSTVPLSEQPASSSQENANDSSVSVAVVAPEAIGEPTLVSPQTASVPLEDSSPAPTTMTPQTASRIDPVDARLAAPPPVTQDDRRSPAAADVQVARAVPMETPVMFSEATLTELANAWLDPRRNQPPEVLAQIVWRLVDERRLPLAYQLAAALGDMSPIPAWVLHAQLLGPEVCTPIGEIATMLGRAFEHFDDEIFEGRRTEWRNAVRFLLAGAAMRPALIAPMSGAPSVLRGLRLQDGLQKLYAYLQQLASFGEQLQTLDPNALRAVRDQTAWRGELDVLQAEVREWMLQAPTMKTRFQAATNVWRRWQDLDKGGVVAIMLAPVLANDASRTDATRKLMVELGESRHVERLIHRTDRDELDRRGKAIDGSALHEVERMLSEARELTRRWLVLQESRPGQQGAVNLVRRVEALRAALVRDQKDVQEEINQFATKANHALVRFGAQACLGALEQVPALFNPAVPFMGREPDPHALAGRDLLLDPKIAVSPTWEPELEGSPLIEALVRVARTPVDWLKAFHSRAAEQDHAATQRILERMAIEGVLTVEQREVLSAERRDGLARCRSALAGTARRTQDRIEDAVALGLLREDDRLQFKGEVEGTLLHLEDMERFSEARGRLERILAAIDERQRVAAELVRQRLVEYGLSPTPDVSARIDRLLEMGDVLAANEHVEALRRGEVMASSSALRDFARARGWTSEPRAEMFDHEWAAGRKERFGGRERLHSAALSMIAPEGVQRRVWSAQVGILFPFLEERRQELVERCRDLLRVPFLTRFGEVRNLQDLEVGHLATQLGDHRNSNGEARFAGILRDVRNRLAHLEPVPVPLVKELERLARGQ